MIPALARTLAHIVRSNPAHKTVVFFTTARATSYFATVFERMAFPRGKLNIVEMHSRKSQSQRTAAAERFRVGKGLVMFSSDVSARGMDYPGISEVLQVGLTDRESYIHRLGRTARAGREGAGMRESSPPLLRPRARLAHPLTPNAAHTTRHSTLQLEFST